MQIITILFFTKHIILWKYSWFQISKQLKRNRIETSKKLDNEFNRTMSIQTKIITILFFTRHIMSKVVSHKGRHPGNISFSDYFQNMPQSLFKKRIQKPTNYPIEIFPLVSISKICHKPCWRNTYKNHKLSMIDDPTLQKQKSTIPTMNLNPFRSVLKKK